MHSNFLADAAEKMIFFAAVDLALVLPAALNLVLIESIDFVATAVTSVDFGEFVGCIELDSIYSNFLVDAPADSLDCLSPLAIYFAEVAGVPFDFGVFVLHIDYGLDYSNPNADAADATSLAVVERRDL